MDQESQFSILLLYWALILHPQLIALIFWCIWALGLYYLHRKEIRFQGLLNMISTHQFFNYLCFKIPQIMKVLRNFQRLYFRLSQIYRLFFTFYTYGLINHFHRTKFFLKVTFLILLCFTLNHQLIKFLMTMRILF